MRILGIESSCDETGVAIYDGERGLVAEQLYSQIDLHADYGGVVPELASRDHVRKLLPLIEQCLRDARLTQHDLTAIAYTAGPGLQGALLVGAALASSLAYGLGIPALPIHHLEAHLLVALLVDPKPSYPFLTLLVSGGHTLLAEATGLGEYTIIGQSLDDAVGESFDKVAKLLGLAYPGGPAIAKLAEQGRPGRITLPRPMRHHASYDFSFSGLKTAVLTQVKAQGDLSEQDKADIAHAFQDAAIDCLLFKAQRALGDLGYQQLVVAGGVSANRLLRQRLAHIDADVFFPPLEYCGDNGAMIAYAGYLHYQAQSADHRYDLNIHARARWPLTEL